MYLGMLHIAVIQVAFEGKFNNNLAIKMFKNVIITTVKLQTVDCFGY